MSNDTNTTAATTPAPKIWDGFQAWEKVKYTSNYGTEYTGWIVGFYPNTHQSESMRDVPLIVTESVDTLTPNSSGKLEKVNTHSDIPLSVRNLGAYWQAYENEIAHRRVVEVERRELRIKVADVENEKVAMVQRAFEEAEKAGYCSEVTRIAELAGIEIPKKQKFTLRVPFTGTILLHDLEGYSPDDAMRRVNDGMIRDGVIADRYRLRITAINPEPVAQQ